MNFKYNMKLEFKNDIYIYILYFLVFNVFFFLTFLFIVSLPASAHG